MKITILMLCVTFCSAYSIELVKEKSVIEGNVQTVCLGITDHDLALTAIELKQTAFVPSGSLNNMCTVQIPKGKKMFEINMVLTKGKGCLLYSDEIGLRLELLRDIVAANDYGFTVADNVIRLVLSSKGETVSSVSDIVTIVLK